MACYALWQPTGIGWHYAICEVDVKFSEPRQVIVPRKGIQELQRLLEDSDEPVQVEVGSNHIGISAADVRFTSKAGGWSFSGL